jgi:hypothetical protein
MPVAATGAEFPNDYENLPPDHFPLPVLSSRLCGRDGYEWTFNAADLDDSLGNGTMAPAGATVPVFAVTDGTTIPHIGGAPARVLSVPQFTDPLDGYNLTFSASGANGGGLTSTNTRSCGISTVLVARTGRRCFRQCADNPAGNDADFYIAPDGAIGLGATYAAAGTIQQNTWYRIGFTANLALNRVTYYVNGAAGRAGRRHLSGRRPVFTVLQRRRWPRRPPLQ